MEETEIFLRLAFLGLGLLLTGLTVAAWYRTKETKLLLASAGFGVLAAQGMFLCAGIFSEDAEALNSIMLLVALNFLALVFLYLSVLKR